MLRVIQQDLAHGEAWDLFVAGAAEKNENFGHYARRTGLDNRTPPDSETTRADTERTVQDVKKRLGAFYRPPITA